MFSGNPAKANMFGSGLGGFLGGLFGDSGAPYDKAMQQFLQYGNRAQQMQQPFYQAGRGAIPQYQDWLGNMKDPSQFINNLMGKYQQSPWAKYQQDQSMRAAQNAGSAGGLTGSTPLTQFMQQNASDISSKDMQNWLGQVLGINSQYGAGLGGLISGGQGSANSLSNILSQLGINMGEQTYNKEAASQNDFWNMLGGLGQIAGSFLL